MNRDERQCENGSRPFENGYGQPFFSIIVPVYNVEEYLKECLDSILAQSFDDYEVICINDGSTDGSLALLEDYAALNNRMRICSQENRGPSAARNNGLRRAQGQYAYYLDADDYVAANLLEDAYKIIKAHDPDVLITGGVSVPPSDWDRVMAPRNAVYKGDLTQALLFEPSIRPLSTCKFYRLSLIKEQGIYFDESISLGEDHVFVFVFFLKAHSAVLNEGRYYFYRQRFGSTMNSAGGDASRRIVAHFDLCRKILNIVISERRFEGNEADYARWYIGFMAKDILALPNRETVKMSKEFLAIMNDYFSNVSLPNECAKLVEMIKSADRVAEDPLVSIIVPVYNAASYLDDSYEGFRWQTMRRFEVLYVDDGSSDDSIEILSRYAEFDDRVTIIRREHEGAGPARNAGLERARGKYLLFLDADDLFDPELLECLTECAETNEADVCVCRARGIDAATGEHISIPWTCNTDMVPRDTCFSRTTCRDNIFCFTSAAPWNKLLRSDFIRSNGLRFQSLPNSNDSYFVILALSCAECITCVDRELLSYRMNGRTSLQTTKSRFPHAFYDALCAIKDGLLERGLYDGLKRPFINFALDICRYYLESFALAGETSNAYEKAYGLLKYKGLDVLGISGQQENAFYGYSEENYQWLQDFERSSSAMEFARLRRYRPYSEIDALNEKLDEASRRIDELEHELEDLLQSYTFRVGDAIMKAPRKLRQIAAKKHSQR